MVAMAANAANPRYWLDPSTEIVQIREKERCDADADRCDSTTKPKHVFAAKQKEKKREGEIMCDDSSLQKLEMFLSEMKRVR